LTDWPTAASGFIPNSSAMPVFQSRHLIFSSKMMTPWLLMLLMTRSDSSCSCRRRRRAC
jgi:hypothetical protein